jgi:hypothetical protein
MARAGSSRRRRAALKTQDQRLFAELAAVFFEVDPAGINFDDNTDEYEPEVGTTLPRLGTARSARDVERILREEFDHWLEGSYDRKRIAVLAERVWQIWSSSGLQVASAAPAPNPNSDRPSAVSRLLHGLRASRESTEDKVARERREWWQPELERSVVLLGASSDDQRAWLHATFAGQSGVVVDELALQFDDLWLEGKIIHAEGISIELRESLEALDQALDDMSGSESADLWTEDALASRPEWANVRSLAGHAAEVLRGEFAPRETK